MEKSFSSVKKVFTDRGTAQIQTIKYVIQVFQGIPNNVAIQSLLLDSHHP